jgi:HK97 family phage prohead protease
MKIKTHSADVEKTGSGSYVFHVSSAAVDRDNDTIDPGGWDLANFRANPVILWAHDYKQAPVGRSVREWVEGGTLRSEVEFTDEGPNAWVGKLVARGVLRATSVGFRPIEAVENRERRGYDFMKQELLEISVVPVPSNPEALVLAKSSEAVREYRRWIEMALDLDGMVAVPKASLADVAKMLAPVTVAMRVPALTAKTLWDVSVEDLTLEQELSDVR